MREKPAGGEIAECRIRIHSQNLACREVAIGSATCLANFNLRRFLPVLKVDHGVGAAQSFIDQAANNRKRILTEWQKRYDSKSEPKG